MVLNMKDNILKGRNMVKEYYILLMEVFIKESLLIMILLEKDCINDLMEEFMMEIGRKIKWME